MRNLRITTTWVAAITLYVGTAGIASAAPPAKDLPAKLVEQLDLSKKALADKGLSLQLVSHAPAVALDTEDAVRAVQTELAADHAVVPQFNGVDASSFSLNSIGERKQAQAAGRETEDVAANIRSVVFPVIKKGQKTLDVMWESKGRKFQSKLVYDDNGIVYDNMLSNIVFIDLAKEDSEKPTAPKETDAVEVRRNASFSVRVFDGTIKWVWGSTRGKIRIDHYVITCDSWRTFCNDGGKVEHWMSLGKTDAQQRRTYLKGHLSKMAWGYAWATPTANISVKFDKQNLKFDVGVSGVGSGGKGAGVHTIY